MDGLEPIVLKKRRAEQRRNAGSSLLSFTENSAGYCQQACECECLGYLFV